MANLMGPPPPPPAQMGPPAPMPTAAGGEPDLAMLEKLKAHIQSLPPGSPQRQALIQKYATDFASLEEMAKRKRIFGEELSQTPGAKGTYTPGRYGTYVGAGPLNHLSTALRQYKGFKDVRGAREESEKLAKMRQEIMQDYITAGLRNP